MVWLFSFDLNVLFKLFFDVEWVFRVFKIDGLDFCDFGFGEFDFLGDFEVGFVDFGRDEKCVSSWGG